MNIFWLDDDPEKAARYHCDKHVTKMCVEYAQILSTAADKGGFFNEYHMYVPVPDINPKVHEWAAESRDNYIRLLKLARHLGDEYEARYGGNHKSVDEVIRKIDISEVSLPDTGLTTPPLCMPDEYKVEEDPVASYRKFYIYGKDWKMSWFNREPPEWYTGKEVVYE